MRLTLWTISAACLVIVLAALAGCTVIKTYEGGNLKETRIAPMWAPLPDLDHGRRKIVLVGAGWLNGLAVGYASVDVTALPERCSAVIITDHPAELAGLVDLNHICPNGG